MRGFVMAELVQVSGTQSNWNTLMQVDPTHDASRASLRPYEHQPDMQGAAGGHFLVNAQTGLIAAPSPNLGSMFQIRWTDPSKAFVLKRLSVQTATATGFASTALGCPLQLFLGHNA